MSKTFPVGSAALRRVIMLAAGLLLLATTAVTASADPNDITGCGQYCQVGSCGAIPNCRTASSGKCKLASNISCGSSDGTISFLDGTDFDLQGYDITCTAGSCSYWVITVEDPSTKITNSTGAESVISGPFGNGITCNGNTSSIVENVTLRFPAGLALYACQTVRHNVVDGQGSGFWGIITTGITSGDSITDNYFTGYSYPVITGTTQTVDILRNVIDTAGATAGISLGGNQASDAGNVKFNILFGNGTTLIAPNATDYASYDGNYCDPAQSSCTSCISSGHCEPYVSPFLGN